MLGSDMGSSPWIDVTNCLVIAGGVGLVEPWRRGHCSKYDAEVSALVVARAKRRDFGAVSGKVPLGVARAAEDSFSWSFSRLTQDGSGTTAKSCGSIRMRFKPPTKLSGIKSFSLS